MYPHMVTLHCRGHNHNIFLIYRKALSKDLLIIQNEDRILMAFCSHNTSCFTEVTLTYEQGALVENGTLRPQLWTISQFFDFHC